MLNTGDHAPDFRFTDPERGETTLFERLREGPAVVSFYPANFTPVCTKQNCMISDRAGELERAGYLVIAVSPQSADSHERFSQRHGLVQINHPDPDRGVIRAFGVSGPLGITRRASFVVGTDGVITHRAVADLSVSPHRRLLDGLIETGGHHHRG